MSLPCVRAPDGSVQQLVLRTPLPRFFWGLVALVVIYILQSSLILYRPLLPPSEPAEPEPPAEYLHDWIAFRDENQCSSDESAYQNIKHHLQIFIDRHAESGGIGSVLTQEDINRAARMSRRCVIEVQPDYSLSVDVNAGSCYGLPDSMKRFSQYLKVGTRIVADGIDEPRVLKRSSSETAYRSIELNDNNVWVRKENQNGGWIDLAKDVCDETLELRDMEMHGFFISPGSVLFSNELVPMFSATTQPDCFADIPLPHYYRGGMSEPRSSSNGEQMEAAWAEKEDTLFWRGSTTGGWMSQDVLFLNFQRPRLLSTLASLSVSGITMDAGFTSPQYCEGYVCDVLMHHYEKPFAPMDQINQFKYLMDVDGQTWSSRFPSLLKISQSLIFKSTVFEDWATNLLKPGEHYIKVDNDYSNLKEKLEWARDSQDEARKIAQNGYEFASRWMRDEDIDCYIFRAILEYEQLFIEPSET